MKIELTADQRKELIETGFIRIEIDECNWIYAESQYGDEWHFGYGEIGHKGNQRYDGYCFDTQDLEKLKPAKPVKKLYQSELGCPQCHSTLTLRYPHCPLCGQKMDWNMDE